MKGTRKGAERRVGVSRLALILLGCFCWTTRRCRVQMFKHPKIASDCSPVDSLVLARKPLG